MSLHQPGYYSSTLHIIRKCRDCGSARLRIFGKCREHCGLSTRRILTSTGHIFLTPARCEQEYKRYGVQAHQKATER